MNKTDLKIPALAVFIDQGGGVSGDKSLNEQIYEFLDSDKR